MPHHFARALAALPLALVPLLTSAPAPATAVPHVVLQLEDAISRLTEVPEENAGYSASAFPHWNRGQDVNGWLPLSGGRECRYIAEWTGTKLRWGLSVDKDEIETLKIFADNGCESSTVIYAPAPA
ncbi:hypothetical protein ACFVIM_28365 [Streptomyces sp. NPDC057638]|uniref:hypothetical protein n=1 Tax=Streptomyces sp. NPDC057638 TaxID=3346190 RepID=UPI0036B69F73